VILLLLSLFLHKISEKASTLEVEDVLGKATTFPARRNAHISSESLVYADFMFRKLANVARA